MQEHISVTPSPTSRRARKGALAFAAVLAIGVACGGVAISAAGQQDSATAAEVQTVQSDWGTDPRSLYDDWSQYSQQYGQQQYGQQPNQQQATQGGATYTEATTASASESAGVVLIDTELAYSGGEAAGTGMVLSSDGLILTNNHVISGSTDITVKIPETGATYAATVVGADATHDVALLQLEGASGLTTVTIDTDDTETVGDAITAVGNASGGGVLMAADGQITGLDASVTTSSTSFEEGETLTGTIEITADVVAGDSGGALLDADGEVIGMTTAASSGTSVTIAYAVTIEDALAIVDQILDSDESGTVTLGYPAFLGVGLAQSYGFGSTGAILGYVYDGTPAQEAGLVAGDTITAVDGELVADGNALAAALATHEPGDSVTITWTDAAGASHSAKVTLIEGPAA